MTRPSLAPAPGSAPPRPWTPRRHFRSSLAWSRAVGRWLHATLPGELQASVPLGTLDAAGARAHPPALGPGSARDRQVRAGVELLLGGEARDVRLRGLLAVRLLVLDTRIPDWLVGHTPLDRVARLPDAGAGAPPLWTPAHLDAWYRRLRAPACAQQAGFVPAVHWFATLAHQLGTTLTLGETTDSTRLAPRPAWWAASGPLAAMAPALRWATARARHTPLEYPLLAITPVRRAAWIPAWRRAGVPPLAPGAPDVAGEELARQADRRLTAALSSPGLPAEMVTPWPALVAALAAAPPPPRVGSAGLAAVPITGPYVEVTAPSAGVTHQITTRGLAAALLGQRGVPAGVLRRALDIPVVQEAVAWRQGAWSCTAARLIATAPGVGDDSRAFALLRLAREADVGGLPLPDLVGRLIEIHAGTLSSGPAYHVAARALGEIVARAGAGSGQALSRAEIAALLATAPRALRLAVLGALGAGPQVAPTIAPSAPRTQG